MRTARLTSSFALLMFLFAASASASTPTHPAYHHGYRWGAKKLLCTSVKTERRKADTVIITVKGKRYWCSKPVAPTFGGTAAKAAVAVRAFYQAKWNPDAGGGLYDGFTHLSCSGAGAVWLCDWQTPAFSGTAKVTFTAKGPMVTQG